MVQKGNHPGLKLERKQERRGATERKEGDQWE